MNDNRDKASLTSEEKNQQELDKNEKMFLKLLTTQLQNQTPDNPADTNQMVQSFYYINQLRNSIQLNAKVEEIKNTMQSSSNLFNSSMMTGQYAVHEGNEMMIGNNENQTIYFKPDSSGAKLELVLLDNANREVFSKTIANYKKNEINQEMLSQSELKNQGVNQGNYKVIVRSIEDKEERAKVYTTSLVDSALIDGAISLYGGKKIDKSQILGITRNKEDLIKMSNL